MKFSLTSTILGLICGVALSLGSRPASAVASANPHFWQNRPEVGHPKDRASILLARPLAKLHGDQITASLVEVHYGPGESSPVHSHPCPVVGYVLEGALRTQVQGEPEAVYHAGESFFEEANGVHAVSANASTTEPAKFVAFFVCDHETPLSVDVAGSNGKGK